MEVGIGPGHIVLDGDPALPPKGAQQTPTFRPMSLVAKRLNGPGCNSVQTEVGLGPGDIVLDGDPVPSQKGAQQPPHVSAHVYCGKTVQLLSSCHSDY